MVSYYRDSRSPAPSTEHVSRLMSANKQKDSKPEVLLRQALWAQGLRGYRLHYKKLPGTPDICFVGRRTAIFVNGCFWHSCPKCRLKPPRNNRQYWQDKFRQN